MLYTLRRAMLVVAVSSSAWAAETDTPRAPSTDGDWVFQNSRTSTERDRPLQVAGGFAMGGGLGAMTASVSLFWMSSNSREHAQTACTTERCVAADIDRHYDISAQKRQSALVSLGTGAAAATVGLALIIVDSRRERRRRVAADALDHELRQLSVTVVPAVPTPQTPPGLVFGGTF